MPPRISVVVPVYNPGRYLIPLLDSLDRQSLPRDELEVIFVDDGSDDGTADALDAWAAGRPWSIVIHQANHGWPGQPRNVGLDHARGKYVYFVDQDDWLGDEALARLVAYGDENGSDVVIGKMKGVGRHVPIDLFARSVPRAVIGRTPLQDSQTPHKVFRKAFLDDIGLRFPEGRRRLEDHLFVTTAFLEADVVSVYADYDCYFHIARADRRNAAHRPFEPADYYANLEEVLDVIDHLLVDGETKDRFLQRWIKNELVRRLRIRSVRDMPRRRDEFFAEISRILRTRIPLSAIRMVHWEFRVGAALARHTAAAQFFRIERALEETVLTASPAEGGAVLSLLDRGQVLAPGSRLSDVLSRHAPGHVVDAVVSDFGEDPVLLPSSARWTAPGGTETSGTLQRDDNGVYRTANGRLREGARVSALTPIGRRHATVSAVTGPGLRLTLWSARVARRARRFAVRLALATVGPAGVDRIGLALRRLRG